MAQLIRRVCTFTPRQIEFLDNQSAVHGLPVTEVIRNAVDFYMRRGGDENEVVTLSPHFRPTLRVHGKDVAKALDELIGRASKAGGK